MYNKEDDTCRRDIKAIKQKLIRVCFHGIVLQFIELTYCIPPLTNDFAVTLDPKHPPKLLCPAEKR